MRQYVKVYFQSTGGTEWAEKTPESIPVTTIPEDDITNN